MIATFINAVETVVPDEHGIFPAVVLDALAADGFGSDVAIVASEQPAAPRRLTLDTLIAAMIGEAIEVGRLVAGAEWVQGENEWGSLVVAGSTSSSQPPARVLGKAVDWLTGWRDYLRGDLTQLDVGLALDLAVATLVAWLDYIRRRLGAEVIALGQKSSTKIIAGYTVAAKDRTASFCRCHHAPVEQCKTIEIDKVAVGVSFKIERTSIRKDNPWLAIARELGRKRRAAAAQGAAA